MPATSSVQNVIDALPLPLQFAVYIAAAIFSIVVVWATIRADRKKEPQKSESVVLEGFNASITDMRPVRELVTVVPEIRNNSREAVQHLQLAVDHLQEAVVQLRDIAGLLRQEISEIGEERRDKRLLERLRAEQGDAAAKKVTR